MTKPKNPHAAALGKLGAKSKWAGTTREERRAALEPVWRARSAKATARRIAKIAKAQQ
jgi:hypothetical protein